MLFRTFSLISLTLLLNPLDAQILGARPLAPAVGIKPVPADPKAGSASSGAAFSVTTAAISRRETVWDQSPLTKLVVTFPRGPAIEVNVDRMADWRYLETRDFAATWINPLAPGVRLGISYLTGPVARSLMAGTAWTTASNTLRRDPKDGGRILINDDSLVNTTLLRPMGQRTRIYEWETVPAAPDGPAQRQLLVAVGDDTQAYLFTLEGPAQAIVGLERSFAKALTSFSPVPAAGAH